jgi:transcription termination factor NusB
METEEIINHIKDLTVQIETSDKKKHSEKGTGVIIKNNKKLFILTVYHCVYGKKEPKPIITPNMINVEIDNIHSDNKVTVINIIEYKENLILLEIVAEKEIDIIEVKCLDRVFYDKNYFTRGYPKIMKGNAHNFNATCNDNNISTVDFRIQIESITKDTSGGSAIDYIQGLSGSGVFFNENGNLYLVGLINSLLNKGGLFDSVDCIKLVDLHFSDLDIEEFISINDISKELREISFNISEEIYEKYKEDKNEYYENLDRKNKCLFHKEEILKKNFHSIRKFFEGQNTINEIKRANNNFEDELLKIINLTIEDIDVNYSKYIDNKQEARFNLSKIKEEVLKKVSYELESIKTDTFLLNQIRDYIIMAWLLNCNLDFKIE